MDINEALPGNELTCACRLVAKPEASDRNREKESSVYTHAMRNAVMKMMKKVEACVNAEVQCVSCCRRMRWTSKAHVAFRLGRKGVSVPSEPRCMSQTRSYRGSLSFNIKLRPARMHPHLP